MTQFMLPLCYLHTRRILRSTCRLYAERRCRTVRVEVVLSDVDRWMQPACRS